MLVAPSTTNKNKNILLVYGHHAMLERWWSLVENLTAYGTVTMPDLPGFGGMDSFAKIGIKPDIDAYADYLASFIKLRFKRKRITIVAISYGFVIATRMLQKHPELSKKVDLLVSIAGFMHHDDFLYSRRQKVFFRCATRFFATRPVAFFIRYGGLNRPVLTFLHKKMPNSKRRMIEVTPEYFKQTMDFEIKIWQANDVRTHWLTSYEFLKLDNCNYRVLLPVVHVVSKQDHYFNNDIVKQHMLVVFTDYKRYTARSKAHTPSVLATKKQAGVMLPTGVRRLLDQA